MRRLVLACAVLATSVLAACGVPVSDTAAPIPDLGRPASASPSSSPPGATSATTVATAWYVEGSRLVPRGVPTASLDGESVLALLVAPPGGSSTLRTLNTDPLGGPPLATWVPDPDGSSPSDLQTVSLSPTFSELASEDQVLLLGQVVLTLTEVDRRPVQFVDPTGTPLSVPLPDGRLRDGPVTRGDYATLT